MLKWRAVCAERCTCGSERRGREIVRLRSASYSTLDDGLVAYLAILALKEFKPPPFDEISLPIPAVTANDHTWKKDLNALLTKLYMEIWVPS